MGKIILFSLCLVLLIILSVDGEKESKSVNISNGKRRKVGATRRQKAGTQGGKKAFKRRSRKKQRKVSERNGRKKSNPCVRQTDIFCPAEKALSLKMLYGQVANFIRQLKRAENHAKIVSKKKDKKDNFQNDAAILQDAVGGDLTAPSCASSRSASTAGEKGQILSNCSNTIASACTDITVNITLLGSCQTMMESFQTLVTSCKTNDSCTCWSQAAGMKAGITACKATDEMNRVKGLKADCLAKFGDCKKAQDSAVEFTASCPSPTSVTTAVPVRRRDLMRGVLARNLIRHHTG